MSRTLLIAALLCLAIAGQAKTVVHKNQNAKRGPDRENITTVTVHPSETDPAIKTFNTSHYIYVNDEILVEHQADFPADRHELLLWIPGTQADESEGPGAAASFCQLAADLGYHVVILKYPNDESASVCREDRDAQAFEKFRLALIEGGTSKHLTIGRSESIENRLIKLLAFLSRTRPDEHWEQFLVGNTPNWSSIAVAGQSQGGGHAALIGLKHQVARVICTGAPKDYSLALDAPATWLSQASATPKNRFFALNHEQDHQACSPSQQLENLKTLGLFAFGQPINVDKEIPPFRHSHILTTNYPGTKLTSQVAHGTGISPRNAAVFEKVWRYLLTEKAP